MTTQTYFQALGFKKFFKISFGLFSALVMFYVLFNAQSYFPPENQLRYTLILLMYGIFGSFIFARQDLQGRLMYIGFLKSIPIFLLYFIPTFIIMFFLLGFTDPLPDVFLSALVNVPLHVLVTQLFVFVTIEASMFQGLFDYKMGIFGSVLVAGIFHAKIWSGSPLINFFGAMFLFLIFSTLHFYIRERQYKKFSGNKKLAQAYSLIAIIGVHFGYNLVKILSGSS